MVMNIGSGFSGGMSGMGMSGSTQNMPQYFLAKYGCEDCFKKEPYWYEYPKPIIPEPKGSLKPSLIRRLINNILGG